MKQTKRIAIVLVIALLAQACGGGFAGNLRSVLAASGPLLDSLVTSGAIKPEQRAGLIKDFEDLAQGAAVLKENLDSCTDKPCRLDAVDKYQALAFGVFNRGHFGGVAKLHNVEMIVRGIIDAAKVYYAPQVVRRDGTTVEQTDTQVKAGIERLRLAMKPDTKVAAVDCNAPRLSFIAVCDEPARHPCQTPHGHELGMRFNSNCQQVRN